jgi:hypothetical protein
VGSVIGPPGVVPPVVDVTLLAGVLLVGVLLVGVLLVGVLLVGVAAVAAKTGLVSASKPASAAAQAHRELARGRRVISNLVPVPTG